MFSLIADKFNTCFLKKIRAWCEDHNLLMVGHLLGDNDPVSSTHQNGNILKCLSTFAIPGVDELHTDFSSNSILPLYGAAEYAATENGAMAELFGIGPCDLSYAKRRCAIFLAACFKINHYFLGCSHLDMRGNLKITDYFSNLSNDQPDFAAMRLLAQEAEKAALYASRDFTPDVYVKYPAEIVAENYASNIDYLPFLELITTLSRHQIQWKYILPSKPCDGVPIIDFGDNLEYIYNEKIYTDADELCKNFAPKIIATTATGDLPKGIFVRHFSDNTFVVLNLFGEESNYLINKKEVFLPKEGVYLSDLEEDTSLATQTEPINTVFSVNYGNNNVTRAVFSKKEPNAEILCEQDFTVILAVRNGEKALLDNKEIPLSTQNNHLLAHGFKALYRTSEPICLTKGEHVISSSNDCKYLPSVFIIGNFNAQTDTKSTTQITLQNRKSGVTANERFCDFGKVDFCAKITVPIGARAIEITDTDLYTTLQINGVLTDEKIYKPYVFKLNPELQGQEIEIKFTQYSSLAPIFGNLEYFTSVIPNKQWAGAPLPQKHKFGFNNLRWVF